MLRLVEDDTAAVRYLRDKLYAIVTEMKLLSGPMPVVLTE
jgi:hypothetical protein